MSRRLGRGSAWRWMKMSDGWTQKSRKIRTKNIMGINLKSLGRVNTERQKKILIVHMKQRRERQGKKKEHIYRVEKQRNLIHNEAGEWEPIDSQLGTALRSIFQQAIDSGQVRSFNPHTTHHTLHAVVKICTILLSSSSSYIPPGRIVRELRGSVLFK